MKNRLFGMAELLISDFTIQTILFIQLSLVLKKDLSLIPGVFSSLVTYFKELLHCGSPDRHVYIMLDGVDHLSPEDGAYGMAWLPSTLPPHVKVVLSTSSEVKYHCYPVLRSLLANHEQNLLQVSNHQVEYIGSNDSQNVFC